MNSARVLLGVFGLTLLASVWLAVPGPVGAQEPPPEPTPAVESTPVGESTPAPTATPIGDPAPNPAGGVAGFFPDPKNWAADVFKQVLVNLLRGISEALRKAVGGVLGSSLNFITQTPPSGSYSNSTVRTLWGVVRGIANGALALVALWGGFNLIIRNQLGSPYHEAMELFPRLIVGALLVNTSLSWGQLAIDANNALCTVVGQSSLPAWERADTATQVLVDVIALVVYLVTSLLLLLQMLMRLALIDVLLVAAPLGLLCWVLPQTQGWARLWSGTFFSTVFTQFVQVLALKLGGSLVTDLTPGAPDSTLLAFFLGVAVLVLALKVPSLMRAHLGDGLGFVRYYVYRQAARALDARTGTGNRGAGPPAAGA